jgi:hypothetical protein
MGLGTLQGRNWSHSLQELRLLTSTEQEEESRTRGPVSDQTLDSVRGGGELKLQGVPQSGGHCLRGGGGREAAGLKVLPVYG